MDERQWLNCTDPRPMFWSMRNSGKASERKLRLFAAAVCRRIWDLLPDKKSRLAVEVVERFADGGASRGELQAARSSPSNLSVVAAQEVAWDAAWGASQAVAQAVSNSLGVRIAGAAVQAALLRDIFSNPFRPPPLIAPEMLQWNGGIVKRLAEQAYQERLLPSGQLDNARLAVLGDALEEAGCTDPDILEHLRQQGAVHVRGCWLIDLLLGKS